MDMLDPSFLCFQIAQQGGEGAAVFLEFVDFRPQVGDAALVIERARGQRRRVVGFPGRERVGTTPAQGGGFPLRFIFEVPCFCHGYA